MTEPWLERWQEGRIGWHEEAGNASLRRHWRSSGRTVLVPLCGKSLDLRWLAGQGNRVVGVELSEIAVQAFFTEQELGYTMTDDELPKYQADDLDIAIYCGDLFELSSLQCDAHYDRGALIALPPTMRPDYAAHVSSLLTDGAEQLVITLNYDDEIANGPPFHVDDSELLDYWPHLKCVEEREDIANGPPKFLEAGLTSLTEKVWYSA